RAVALEKQGLVLEIPYRLFDRLDDALFAGQLKDTIFLDIERLDSNIPGATYTASSSPNPQVRRISILLNTRVFEYATSREIVAILIHHMIHAYFLVACGPQQEDEVDYGRLSHGVHFCKILYTIQDLSAAYVRDVLPINFRLSTGESLGLAVKRFSPWRQTSFERGEKERWYHSHCCCSIEDTSRSHVEQWYRSCCRPMIDLPKSIRNLEVYCCRNHPFRVEINRRARLPPSAETVEFLFDGRPIIVERKHIEGFPSVRKAFYKAYSRFLCVHHDIETPTFYRFLNILHTCSYQPNLLGRASIRGTEPPIIRPTYSDAEPLLLCDIRFATLGILMGFDECKNYGLNCMNSHSALHEDPITILREIYCNEDPDPDLRAWVREFLVRMPTSLLGSVTEPPNLIKLKSDYLPHCLRFAAIVNASSALEDDVNRAQAEIKRAG
ncbi:hypothetical protein IQ07DRAFT_472471, partial [Pyrenochaeta sp. DS3sAY3a]